MAVTFKCLETFSVTHAETGALLQGWEGGAQEVEHCVVFEIDLDKHAHLSRCVVCVGWFVCGSCSLVLYFLWIVGGPFWLCCVVLVGWLVGWLGGVCVYVCARLRPSSSTSLPTYYSTRTKTKKKNTTKPKRDWRIIDIDGWLDGNEYLAGVSDDGGDASAAGGAAGGEGQRGKGE